MWTLVDFTRAVASVRGEVLAVDEPPSVVAVGRYAAETRPKSARLRELRAGVGRWV